MDGANGANETMVTVVMFVCAECRDDFRPGESGIGFVGGRELMCGFSPIKGTRSPLFPSVGLGSPLFRLYKRVPFVFVSSRAFANFLRSLCEDFLLSLHSHLYYTLLQT